jgi:uncharacterized membrane protein (UPF0182 family)
MPQLKKVALAMGNRLAYADTYEQALAQLVGEVGGNAPEANAPPQTAQATGAPNASVPVPPQLQRSVQAIESLQQIRDHLARYRELSAQGKWAEAGKELDEIQRLVQK